MENMERYDARTHYTLGKAISMRKDYVSVNKLPENLDRLWLRPVTVWTWLSGRDKAAKSGPMLKVPVRVDPRTLESNERLYLTYLNHLTWIGTIGAILVTFIPREYTTFSFMLILGALGLAFGLSLYAFTLKTYRSTYLMRFDNVHYEDPIGAAILTGVLIAIMLGIFSLTLYETISGVRLDNSAADYGFAWGR